jgi:two-component system, response regulator RegA
MADPTFPSLKRVLVVEDDRPLCAALSRIARSGGAEVWEANTVAEGRVMLAHSPELVMIDLWLEGESAMELVEEAAHHRPAPAILAISGRASTEEAFRLGQLGVRGFLPKPLFQEQLVDKAHQVLGNAPDVEPWISAHVGKTPLKTMLSEVRDVMLEEALAKANGSRSGAARLLQVTRQAIQQVFHRRSSDDDHESNGGGTPPPAH